MTIAGPGRAVVPRISVRWLRRPGSGPDQVRRAFRLWVWAARGWTIVRVTRLRSSKEVALFSASTVLLLAGGLAWLLSARTVALDVWILGTVLGLCFSVLWTVTALRRGQLSVDVVALLALAGAIAVKEPFAGAMITVMLASGQLLEARAAARARRELSLLVERAPRTAKRVVEGGVVEVPVDDLVVGDLLLVGTGEIVPVDGRLRCTAVLDESALTGEPMPVERLAGDDVRSGVVNAGTAITMVATALAAESTYAGVVRLVEQAQASSAPFVRAADRFAILFVPLTLLLAGASWALSGDAVRAVAVLVVATPCPLLLAAPIAIMSGLSRAAHIGVVVKGGSALERLAGGQIMLFDKTGTLTQGHPVLTDVVTAGDLLDADEVLRLAASLDQVSAHVLASAIVSGGTRRGLALEMPEGVHEVHGYGLEGTVGAHRVKLGKAGWIVGDAAPPWVRQVRRRADLDGSLTVFVAVDDQPAGAILLEDTIRPDAPRMVRAMRGAGITRVVLLTGDRADVAEMVGRIVGVDTVLADCDPAEKLAAIERESAAGPTIMVGDGINDAPALAAAGVGVALAARGATASSEAADVVLTVDRVDALADAILIAQRSKAIAVQSVLVGMTLSLVAMVLAAVGLLPPVVGAVVQEVIDVLAIGIALRGVLPGKVHTIAMTPADVAIALQLRAEHDAVLPVIEQIRSSADGLSTRGCDLAPVRTLLDRLEGELLPHERADEELLVPLMGRALGGTEATAAMSRTHAEIEHQVGKLRRLLVGLDAETTQPEDVVELRRLLYGLYAVLRLHNAQEEEGAFSLVPQGSRTSRR